MILKIFIFGVEDLVAEKEQKQTKISSEFTAAGIISAWSLRLH